MSSENENNLTDVASSFEKTSVELESAVSDGSETDGTASSDPVSASVGENTKRIHKRKPNVSLIAAFCILIIMLIGFTIFRCFFNTSIVGSWDYSFSVAGRNYNYSLDFRPDKTVVYNYGSISYKGRYSVDRTAKGNKIRIGLTSYGQEFVPEKLDFDITGNVFSGRTLSLTDRSGFIIQYDRIDSQNDSVVSLKKQITDSIEENGNRYYILRFKESGGNKSDPYENSDSAENSVDEKLTGTWLYKDEDGAFNYTITFDGKGVFVRLSEEVDIKGRYTASDGVCKYITSGADGSESEDSFRYSVNGDNLIIEIDSQKTSLKRTDDPYAFKS